MIEKYAKMNYFKRKGWGLMGVTVGMLDGIDIHFEASVHGHYHPRDSYRLSRAKGVIKHGFGMIRGDRNLVAEGLKQMRKNNGLIIKSTPMLNFKNPLGNN